MLLATVIILHVTVFKLFNKYISYPESTQYSSTDLQHVISYSNTRHTILKYAEGIIK